MLPFRAVTVARSDRRPQVTPSSPLPHKKGREVAGLLLFVPAFLVLISLVSHHPEDPSLFHYDAGETTRNWIGSVGAEVSALLFSLVGLPAFGLPFVLLLVGWRLLWRDPSARVTGRGVGTGLLLLSLPPFVQLLFGVVDWRGVAMEAGGVFGLFVERALLSQLDVLGSLVVLVGVLAVGLALALQSSLEEILSGALARLRGTMGELVLLARRLRERRAKERARRRVVSKHLERAKEQGTRSRELVSARVKAQQSTLARPGPVRVIPRAVSRESGAGDSPQGLVDLPVERVRSSAATVPKTPPRGSETKGGPTAAAESAAPARQQSLALGKPHRTSALPPINLLNLEKSRPSVDEDELVRLGEVICRRCAEFGVEGTIEGISPGPVITVFEFQPAPGVKVSRIVNLQDDLALALRAEAVRIDRLPGRSTLGIEVPNPERSIIRLGPLLADDAFRREKSPLTMALGQTLHGENYYVDLAAMPHLLVAGATGAGKSVGLQSMITSLLYKSTREQVQFIFIDPKRIELGVYANIPHLKAEVVVEPKKAANALRWAVGEMERRYRLLAEVHVRSIDFYNRAITDPEIKKRLSLKEDEDDAAISASDLMPLPYYVIVIDELADLMMVSTAEVETAIARLAQMARAVGIHLIVATQRPSVDVLTGMIKANFPCRLSYSVASRHDSRTILDAIGAEKLLGQGDMLFMPAGSARILRLHGAYVSEQETAALVRWLKKQGKPELDPTVLDAPEDSARGGGGAEDPDDDLYEEAARLVVSEGKASASFLQRRMRIGFSRAARLIDLMEHDGLLGPSQGSKPREILVKPDYFEEIEA